MKKLAVVTAITVGSFSTFAATPVIFHDGVMEDVIRAQEEFTEIEVSKLPAAITKALGKDYPGASIDKAYVNENEEYKLDVSHNDDDLILYANKTGNWIEKD
ncbi:hypothetical protein JGC31_08465 [Zhouia sp. CL16]|nr:hypothetical protein [Zhouia amylolytica]